MAGDFKLSNIIVPVLVTYLAISLIFLSPSATSTNTVEGNSDDKPTLNTNKLYYSFFFLT